MREAYLITIRDFEIAIRNLPWWNFYRASLYQKRIDYYEKLLNKLENYYESNSNAEF